MFFVSSFIGRVRTLTIVLSISFVIRFSGGGWRLFRGPTLFIALVLGYTRRVAATIVLARPLSVRLGFVLTDWVVRRLFDCSISSLVVAVTRVRIRSIAMLKIFSVTVSSRTGRMVMRFTVLVVFMLSRRFGMQGGVIRLSRKLSSAPV